jgi:hypothetical protein
MGLGIALLTAVITLVAPAPAASDDKLKCSHDPVAVFTRDAVPVVLVHGWIKEAKFMKPVQRGLKQRLGSAVTLLPFDYSAEAYHWASHPNIAVCLANYIKRVSAAQVEVGGDPRVSPTPWVASPCGLPSAPSLWPLRPQTR